MRLCASFYCVLGVISRINKHLYYVRKNLVCGAPNSYPPPPVNLHMIAQNVDSEIYMIKNLKNRENKVQRHGHKRITILYNVDFVL